MPSTNQIPTLATRVIPLPVDRVAYTVTEAAQALRISRTSIYRLNAAGRIRFVKLNGSTRIPASEISALMAEDTAAAERVADSRRSQGLPPTVEDVPTLQRVATLVREAGAADASTS